VTTSRTRDQLQRANQMQHRDNERMAGELRRVKLAHGRLQQEYDAAHGHRLDMQRAVDDAMGIVRDVAADFMCDLGKCHWCGAWHGDIDAARSEHGEDCLREEAKAWLARWSGVQSGMSDGREVES
jgi:hypothetical protein